MYDFRSSLPYYSAENQSLEFCHPKFKRGRPDLLHEIKRKPFEPNLTMKDEVEFFGDLGHVPAQLGAIQNEDMRMWDSSKIINKYLLAQVSDAKIALTHDRDWSYVAKMVLDRLYVFSLHWFKILFVGLFVPGSLEINRRSYLS
ncbi:hypothetical protein BYT27DRAFT_7146710, partial [Phlegmacium glaucopus]